MAHSIAGRDISTVYIVDDSVDSRSTLRDELKFAAYTPRVIEGPFQTSQELFDSILNIADAVVCDHHLNTRNFAPCSGAEAISHWYFARIPSVMVTKWSKADVDQLRRYRRQVPVILTPEEASNTDNITKGFEICIEEFNDNFLPSRKPWRNLVRIEEVDTSTRHHIVYAVIPGWDSNEVVRFPIDIIPVDMHLYVKPGSRFYAKINMGAPTQELLYFSDFEYKGE